MFRKLMLAIAAVALSAATVQASDIYTPDNAYTDTSVPPRSWTGLWLGAVGGYQFSNTELNFDGQEVEPGDPDELEKTLGINIDGLGAQGLFGEAQVGYDHQINQRLLIGLFAGYGVSDAEFTAGYDYDDIDDFQSSGSVSFDQEWSGVVGLRLGMIKSQDTMFYAAGGWAFGELGEVTLTSDGVSTKYTPEETDLSGWFAEIGAEQRLVGNIYGTIAGRYTSYGAVNIASDSGDCGSNDVCSYTLEAEKDDMAVLVGIKAKLGGM